MEQCGKDHPAVKDVNYRIRMLGRLYNKLPSISVLKGVCCYLLAQYESATLGTKAAEKRYFESVYIFDQTPGIVESVPVIVSDFGIRALIEFGEVLDANGKYPLASFSYKGAADCFKLCHGDYNYDFIGHLVKLSQENGDWKRTIEYLHILLNKAQLDGDTAKVAHLSERLSDEYMDKGDFKNAEEYLCKSINFVKGVTSGAATTTAPGQKTGGYELNLQLRLVKLYLQGYYFERGIDLLAKITEV